MEKHGSKSLLKVNGGAGDQPSLSHVAIIMDGNGRWATKRGMPRMFGHQKGVSALRRTLKYLYNMDGVNTLSIFAFSSENWKRPEEEVSGLINLIRIYVKSEIDELDKKGVRLTFMGDLSAFPDDVQSLIIAAQNRTKDNGKFILNVGINYGGRQEIVASVKRMIESHKGSLEELLSSLDVSTVESFLDTSLSGITSPDLVIRTSGEKRISNFMLWQMAYSELYFSEVFWPDFNEEELQRAIDSYHKRERRFGAVSLSSSKVVCQDIKKNG